MWNGFEERNFIFQEREAKIIIPNCTPNGRLILKTEYWDAFPNFEIEMVKRGYYLCFISHQTRWAPDHETKIMAEFVEYVAQQLNIPAKCAAVGMSCGGLQALRLAQLYPHLIAALYLDAPVCNILSMAGLGDKTLNEETWRELINTYGFSRASVVNFRRSPIDFMDILIEHDIPIIMLYGNKDTAVFYEENGKVLEDFYRENGGRMKVICRSMKGHHPHSLDDPTPIITFVEENWKA